MATFWDHFVVRMFATFTESSPSTQPVGGKIVEYACDLRLFSAEDLSDVPLALLLAIVTPGSPVEAVARREVRRRRPGMTTSLAVNAQEAFPVRVTEAAIAANKPGMAYDVVYEIAKSLYLRSMGAFIKALRMQSLGPDDKGESGRLAGWLREAITTCGYGGLRRDLLVPLYFECLLDEGASARVARQWPVNLPVWYPKLSVVEQTFLECAFAAGSFRVPVLWTVYADLNAIQITAIIDGLLGSTYSPDLGPLFRAVVEKLDTAWRRTLECMAAKL